MSLSDEYELLVQISVVLAKSDPDYRELQRLAKTVKKAHEVEFDCRACKEDLLKWLRQRLVNKDEALYDLGLRYKEGTGGVDKDPKKAVALFQQAADQNHLDAQCELGRCYLYGWGVDEDDKRAVALFRQSIDQCLDHWVEAHFELGRCYLYGWGVEEDLNQALGLLRYSTGRLNDETDLRICREEIKNCLNELRKERLDRQMEADHDAREMNEMLDNSYINWMLDNLDLN